MTFEQFEEWYVLFDDQDKHPVTGESMGGHYVVFSVADRETARREACRRFGDQWAALLPKVETDAAGGPGGEPLDDKLWGGATEGAHLLEAMFGPTYAGRR